MSEKKKPQKADRDESAKKREILEKYAKLVRSGLYFPTRADMKGLGFSRDLIRHHYGNMSGLRENAKLVFPDSFAGSIDIEDYISDEYLADLQKDIKKNNRFVITTAVSGQKLHAGFMASIRNYCKLEKAKLLILPAHDPAHNLDNDIEWHFDETVLDDAIVFEDTTVNSNFFISGIRVTAKQVHPITGLTELSQTKGSFIMAGAKQELEYDSVSANKLPHARMTSGACTLPNYKSTKGNSLRTAYIAHFQHVLGAVIVEVEDDVVYHVRQVQAAKDGSFCEAGFEYGPDYKEKSVPILVMGDYHAGEQDETAVQAWTEIINAMGVEEVVFHDMFNGVSVNPHEEDDMMLRAERAEKGLNVLKNEIKLASTEFDRILSLKSVKRGVVVKSNHDDMLDRYINKAKFSKDPANFRFGCQLAAAVGGTKKDYFKEAMDIAGCRPVNHAKLKWLTVDQDYVVGGVHLGAHGDKSANGARGSIKGLAKSYTKGVIGHSHTPGIFKNMFQVGTTSLLRLGYNKGPSSWVHCSCLVYKNGQRQLINSINGKWRLHTSQRKAA